MSGHKKFDSIKRAQRSPDSTERLQRLRGLYRDVYGLGELRETRGHSQVNVASEMGVSQANVSRVEHSPGVYLSTVERYVEALGGKLKLVAEFPDQSIELPLIADSWRSGEASEGERRDNADRAAS